MTLKSITKIIATVMLLLGSAKLLQAFDDVNIKTDNVNIKIDDVNIKIDNKNNKSIRYAVYNYKYTDDDIIWEFLAANATTFASIPYTTKYGYFELRIDAEGKQLRYIPSGNHLTVTVRVEDDIFAEKTVKFSRLIGFK